MITDKVPLRGGEQLVFYWSKAHVEDKIIREVKRDFCPRCTAVITSIFWSSVRLSLKPVFQCLFMTMTRCFSFYDLPKFVARYPFHIISWCSVPICTLAFVCLLEEKKKIPDAFRSTFPLWSVCLCKVVQMTRRGFLQKTQNKSLSCRVSITDHV
jgi:hypothetical protein